MWCVIVNAMIVGSHKYDRCERACIAATRGQNVHTWFGGVGVYFQNPPPVIREPITKQKPFKTLAQSNFIRSARLFLEQNTTRIADKQSRQTKISRTIQYTHLTSAWE